MSITKQTEAFEALLRSLPEGQWEVYDGEPREKPPMSFPHNDVIVELGFQLRRQLRRVDYRIRINSSHVNHGTTYYIPDLFVLSMASEQAQHLLHSDRVEVYDEPLPLIVEVWSPSTGTYDVNAKIPMYQGRGDREIWRIHPDEGTVTIWRRQPNGTDTEHLVHGGKVEVTSLTGVVIDLDALWE